MNLTPLEQRAIAFISCSLFVGALVRLFLMDERAPLPLSPPPPLTISETDSSGTGVQAALETVGKTSALPDNPINVNSAPQAMLQRLPGIGPKLALRIVEYRDSQGPFSKPDDLRSVKGIGPAMLKKLAPLIQVP